MQVFAASDIVEVAIRIEENGINFYKFAEQIARQEDAKKLFSQLAQAEAAGRRPQSTLQLALQAGVPVAAVPGEKHNIKLTTKVTKMLRSRRGSVAASSSARIRWSASMSRSATIP